MLPFLDSVLVMDFVKAVIIVNAIAIAIAIAIVTVIVTATASEGFFVTDFSTTNCKRG